MASHSAAFQTDNEEDAGLWTLRNIPNTPLADCDSKFCASNEVSCGSHCIYSQSIEREKYLTEAMEPLLKLIHKETRRLVLHKV